MHDRTRRWLCRAGFCLFCLLPTLGTVSAIAISRSPTFRAAEKTAWEHWLTTQSGLQATLTEITHPTHDLTLLDGLVLTDRETGAVVCRVRQIEISGSHDQRFLRLAQPEIHREHVWCLWELLHQRVLRGESEFATAIQSTASELTLFAVGGELATSLVDVRCRLFDSPQGRQATFEFRDITAPDTEPAVLRVTRNRQLSPPATRWELDTRTTALPCSLLADYAEAFTGAGPHATFQGTIAATNAADGWEGEISGRFTRVDLDRLVSDRFPHKLSGLAEISLQRARFRGGRVIDVAGSITAGGGVVSLSLLEQAERTLGLRPGPALQLDDQSLWRYQQLAFDFTIGSRGLQLVGRCVSPGDLQPAAEGILLADAQGPLLTNPQYDTLPVVALVRALSPASEIQVPATRETDALLRALPIPEIAAPAATAENPRRIFSPLRLR
jgi:hypothetical protein